jgi:hypothetical protein
VTPQRCDRRSGRSKRWGIGPEPLCGQPAANLGQEIGVRFQLEISLGAVKSPKIGRSPPTRSRGCCGWLKVGRNALLPLNGKMPTQIFSFVGLLRRSIDAVVVAGIASQQIR